MRWRNIFCLFSIALVLALISISTPNIKGQTADTEIPDSYVNPIDGLYHNSSIVITATATDFNGSGIKSVELWYYFSPIPHRVIDDIQIEGYHFSSDNESPWEWTFDFPKGNGYYEFYTIAEDQSGNKEFAYIAGSPTPQASCYYLGDSPNINLIVIIAASIVIIAIFVYQLKWKRINEK